MIYFAVDIILFHHGQIMNQLGYFYMTIIIFIWKMIIK
jgi:hypothetical protein